MDKQEAKMILQALRPKDLNSDKPDVIAALIFVEGDPELKAWWEAERSFDLKIAAKLKEVAVPADLRDTILKGNKIVPLPTRPQISLWLAAAAMVAILCVAGTFMQVAAFGPLPRTDYVAAVLPMLNNDSPALQMTSTDHDKIVAWLKQRNAPTGGLPSKMATLPTVGCEKFTVHGHDVSLICFTMADGHIAHLFIVEQKALTDPPAVNTPQFDQADQWSTAAWSDGHMSYLLATQAGGDALKQLL